MPEADDIKPGTLYLVGTPIGNLSDITLRAVETLRGASLIAAEDTRRTRLLCQRHGIDRPLVSLHGHNEQARTVELIQRLQNGESIALVTDAGMPVLSDPGAILVKGAADAGIPVTAVPGPSAVVAALAISGLRGERFRFEGFPPRKPKALAEWLHRMAEEPAPVVCFESPYRLVKTLRAIQQELGEIPVVVGRELTKLHEEVARGSTSELLARYTQRAPQGEVTLIFQPKGAGGISD
ncbi:MAG: 16S rRNA (cytidine(1402)-2'-O)-methyltransferase [Candidatus Omnitrophica bacterium]|nr:16S rRNA (cytidine(1402)-2'-O)-methyltransferase [Candidatus Omnitrophota bacterium]